MRRFPIHQVEVIPEPEAIAARRLGWEPERGAKVWAYNGIRYAAGIAERVRRGTVEVVWVNSGGSLAAFVALEDLYPREQGVPGDAETIQLVLGRGGAWFEGPRDPSRF